MKKVMAAILLPMLLFLVTACSQMTVVSPPAPVTSTLPAADGVPADDASAEDIPATPDSSLVPVSEDETFQEENRSEIIMGTAVLSDKYYFRIYAIDPDTGESRVVSTFNIPKSIISREDGSEWRPIPMLLLDFNSHLPLREIFSKDYKYVASTIYSPETGEWRAGLFKDGEDMYYADVTQLTGAVGSDFDAPPMQIALGFADNNQFIYADANASANNSSIGYVPDEWTPYQVEVFDVNNVGSSQPYDEINDFLLREDDWNWMEKYWELTNLIDETHYLINYPEASTSLDNGVYRIERWGVRIFDTVTQELNSFIPGESRSNWSGVISPDKESVAFLSAPANGTGNAALYITSVDGGEPVKILDEVTAGRSLHGNVWTRPNSQNVVETKVSFLLEWREAS
ncbi:MAG: hypothetical protein HDT26_11035 [Subdoligranulum sp.]|nr:hypothetical protein [Subdoligranulum sp.]